MIILSFYAFYRNFCAIISNNNIELEHKYSLVKK
jgi:hypothetical protein